ncbi:hypothetical protein B0H19DRAFT_1077710 [Mycena capillaripes]|nr:hypothetical protein B0H19DRAFT_1077710 [Mycena capillaripes]
MFPASNFTPQETRSSSKNLAPVRAEGNPSKIFDRCTSANVNQVDVWNSKWPRGYRIFHGQIESGAGVNFCFVKWNGSGTHMAKGFGRFVGNQVGTAGTQWVVESWIKPLERRRFDGHSSAGSEKVRGKPIDKELQGAKTPGRDASKGLVTSPSTAVRMPEFALYSEERAISLFMLNGKNLSFAQLSDVQGSAQARKPSRAGPGLDQAGPSPPQGFGGPRARA